MRFRRLAHALFLTVVIGASGCCCWHHHRCGYAEPVTTLPPAAPVVPTSVAPSR